VFAEDFASEGESADTLLDCRPFAERDAEVTSFCIGGEGTHLAANFHCAGVRQVRRGGIAILFA
jgi:hypothetical protein